MASNAQNEANERYRSRIKAEGRYKQISLCFYPGDLDVYEHIAKQGNKSVYIKNLVRKDMSDED
jgi:hypothetical protein|nr:MAG TPA: hypothetical protein [Caudoviricetes sp.]